MKVKSLNLIFSKRKKNDLHASGNKATIYKHETKLYANQLFFYNLNYLSQCMVYTISPFNLSYLFQIKSKSILLHVMEGKLLWFKVYHEVTIKLDMFY